MKRKAFLPSGQPWIHDAVEKSSFPASKIAPVCLPCGKNASTLMLRMWEWIQTQLLEPFASLIQGGLAFLLTNVFAIIGFVLALIIIRRAFTEKRTPSNFFAWLLVVLFSPLIGVPLYLMFGGRKSRKNTRVKLEVAREAQALVDDKEGSACATNIFACEGRGMVTVGNHVELLPDGETAFARLCKEIELAKQKQDDLDALAELKAK